MTKERFYGWAIAQLIEAGVDIKLLQRRTSGKAGGIFYFPDEGDPARFVVCLKSERHFETFLHEFCHFLQWRDNPEKWAPVFTNLSKFWNWLDGNRKNNPGVEAVQQVELDCEKKVVKLIKKYKLPIDIDAYVQRAAVYVFSYLLTEEYRKEYSKPGMCYDPDIYPLFPTKFKQFSYYQDKANIPLEAMTRLRYYYE